MAETAELPPGFKWSEGAMPPGFKAVEAPKPRKAAHATYADRPGGPDYSPLVGGFLDTLGFTQRPGARTSADVILKPQGFTEHAVQAAVTAPLIAGGGAGVAALTKASGIAAPWMAAAAPAIGRMFASGAIGAVEGGARGDTLKGMGMDALFDAAIAGLVGEVLPAKLISGLKLPFLPESTRLKGLAEAAAPAKAYKWATEAVDTAVDAIKGRIPKSTKLNVPSLSPTPISLEEAAKKLATMEQAAYTQTRSEIIGELNRLDKGRTVGGMKPGGTYGPVPVSPPYAGSQVQKMTSPRRFAPKAGAKVAEAAEGALTDANVRAAMDALGLMDVGGIPAGALPIAAGASKVGGLFSQNRERR